MTGFILAHPSLEISTKSDMFNLVTSQHLEQLDFVRPRLVACVESFLQLAAVCVTYTELSFLISTDLTSRICRQLLWYWQQCKICTQTSSFFESLMLCINAFPCWWNLLVLVAITMLLSCNGMDLDKPDNTLHLFHLICHFILVNILPA
jgi:hypothetical protein